MPEDRDRQIPAANALRILRCGPSKLRCDCQRLLGKAGEPLSVTEGELLALAAVERLRYAGIIEQPEWCMEAEQMVASAILQGAACGGADPRTQAIIVADGEYLAVPPLRHFIRLRTGEALSELPEAPVETWRLDILALADRIRQNIEDISGETRCRKA